MFRHKIRKKGKEHLLHDAERNVAFFERFNPTYVMYIGPSSEETYIFERYREKLTGTLLDISTKVTDFHTVDKRIFFCENVQTPKSVGLYREG